MRPWVFRGAPNPRPPHDKHSIHHGPRHLCSLIVGWFDPATHPLNSYYMDSATCQCLRHRGGERAGCREFLVLLRSPCNFAVHFHVRRRLDPMQACHTSHTSLTCRADAHGPTTLPPSTAHTAVSPAYLQPPFVQIFRLAPPHSIDYRLTVLSPPLGPLPLSHKTHSTALCRPLAC